MSTKGALEGNVRSRHALVIRFPQRSEDEVAQDEEWCEVVDGETVTKVRFHDYAQIFSTPGLYNQLFGGVDSETKCISPQIMAELLKKHMHHLDKTDPATGGTDSHRTKLRVVDFGAGNGMLGEEVRKLADAHEDRALAKSTLLLGFDILPEAKLAAERDRPGTYDAYVVADITKYLDSPDAEPSGILRGSFNVLVSVSALSFGDASATAFKAAISLIQIGGLVLFNLKAGLFADEASDGLQDTRAEPVRSDTGFSKLIREAVDGGRLEVVEKKTYCHRFSVTGKPLYYVALAAIKRGDLE